MTHHDDQPSSSNAMEDVLKRALENVPEPRAARPEFRDSMRARFVQGTLAEGEGPGERMQRALDSADAPAASQKFRESLRAQFVGGAASTGTEEVLAEREQTIRRPGPSLVAVSPDDDVDQDDWEGEESEQESGRSDRNGALRIVRWIAPLTLAAAAVLLLLNPAIGSKPEWEVIEFPSSAAPVWDGQPISAVELLPEDRRWSSIETGSERLRLKWSDDLLVEVGADSQVSWEPLLKDAGAAADDPNASPCLRAGKGGVNFTARDSDKPVRLFVETPEAKIELRGTTVGVDLVDGLGTCVCVVEGSVTVTTKVGDAQTIEVEEGFSCFIFADGRGPSTFDLYEQHGGPVRELAGDGDRHFAANSPH